MFGKIGTLSNEVMLFRTPEFIQMLYPELVWQKPVQEKILYLTFDDGPMEGVTEFVLHTLAQHQAQATFFCIGNNIEKYPEVFEQLKLTNHRIGNHTFNHLNGWKTADPFYFENTARCQQHIPYQAGPLLFRPPYGRIKRNQISILKSDYDIIMWTTLSKDYDQNLKAENCLKKTIKTSTPGSIVLFHDSHKARRNLEYVLPRYLEHFSKLGYRFLGL